VAVPTDVNKLSFSAHFAWDLAACTSFSLSWSCTGPAPRNLLSRQIADLPFQAVGRESAESPQNVALESPRSDQASAWAGPPTITPHLLQIHVVKCSRRVAGAEGRKVVVVSGARPASLWARARGEGDAVETAVVVDVGAVLHVAADRGAVGLAHGAQQATAARVGGDDVLQVVGFRVVEDLGCPHGAHMMHVNLLAPPVERAQHQRSQRPPIAVNLGTKVADEIRVLGLLRRLHTTALCGLGGCKSPPNLSHSAPQDPTLADLGRSCVVRQLAARWALALAGVRRPAARPTAACWRLSLSGKQRPAVCPTSAGSSISQARGRSPADSAVTGCLTVLLTLSRTK